MKISLFSIALAAVLFGGMLPVEAQQSQPAAVATPGASAWQSPEKLRQKLATEIAKRAKNVDTKSIQQFVKDDENRRLLLMYHLVSLDCARQEDY